MTSSGQVGGVAVSTRSEARFTRDLDLAIAVSGDTETEALVRGLIVSGYSVQAILEQDETGRIATARMVPYDGDPKDVVVDLLFATTGIEPEIVAQATSVEIWPGTFGQVARIGHLIAMKLLSRSKRRPLDQADLVALMDVADAEEIALAYEAARLIEVRGCARDRTLVEDLRRLIAELEA